MAVLKFDYKMELHFSTPVQDHYFALRSIPVDSQRQTIHIDTMEIDPDVSYTELKDGFGNYRISGCCTKPHTNFGFHISGTAKTQSGVHKDEPLHPMYKYPSRYTQPSKALKDFAEEIEKDCKRRAVATISQKAMKAMHAVHRILTYTPGVTDIHTTAAQAFELKQGVCQDYAHILITVLRLMGIPARYVNGFMIGEGATHAWVEAYVEDGWFGLDPTNDLMIDSYYIDLAAGRDYDDCVIDRGKFLGLTTQRQSINVSVEAVEK